MSPTLPIGAGLLCNPTRVAEQRGYFVMRTLEFELPADLGEDLEALGLNPKSKLSEWVADAKGQKLSASNQLKNLETQVPVAKSAG